MNENKKTGDSKFISLILRHAPETIDLRLDEGGWADVAELLDKAAAHGRPISAKELHEIVATSDKKRFAFSDDGTRIRANQGHSLAAVDLKLAPATPPAVLYHGTADRFIASIRQGGLHKGERQHVHLSALRDAAMSVGARHGRPVVLSIDAQAMHLAGHPFYLSANGVWLAEAVPASFIAFPAAG